MKKMFTFLSFFFSACGYAQDSLAWSTYFGGPGGERITCIARDASGHIYFAGQTNSASGISFSGFQAAYGGGANDGFIVKLDAAGNLLWSSYYGGSGSEDITGLAVDAAGNIYAAGSTYSVSGIAANGFQNTVGGNGDAFLVKFDSSGSRIWGTYYGGAGMEGGHSVTLDTSGSIYLTGYSTSTSGIASGGFQNSYGGGTTDAFVVKFSSAGSRLWGTYFGGNSSEYGYCLATGSAGSILLAGNTNSSSAIALNGFQNTFGGGTEDAFLAKFDLSGNLLWATYYGGPLSDAGNGVACDSLGNIYLAGTTWSSTGIASGGFQNNIGGACDAFLAAFSSGGSRIWATYFGGSAYDFANKVATADSGSVVIAGRSQSTSNISISGWQNAYNGGLYDGILASFSASGIINCATYIGGAGYDQGIFASVADDGSILFSGSTDTTDAIAFNGYQNVYGGGISDGLLMKLQPCDNTTSISETALSPGKKLFPNPTSGEFWVDNEGDVAVYTILGERVLLQKNVRGNMKIDLSGFEAGVYIVEWKEGGKTIRQKLVRQ